MTIKELIEELKDYPEDSPVWVLDDEGFISHSIELVTDTKKHVGIIPLERAESSWGLSQSDN